MKIRRIERRKKIKNIGSNCCNIFVEMRCKKMNILIIVKKKFASTKNSTKLLNLEKITVPEFSKSESFSEN